MTISSKKWSKKQDFKLVSNKLRIYKSFIFLMTFSLIGSIASPTMAGCVMLFNQTCGENSAISSECCPYQTEQNISKHTCCEDCTCGYDNPNENHRLATLSSLLENDISPSLTETTAIKKSVAKSILLTDSNLYSYQFDRLFLLHSTFLN